MNGESRHIADLSLHPILAKQPRMQPISEEFMALVRSIHDRGLDYPIIINHRNQILDGRHRWMAARVVGLDQLPVIVADEGEAPEIILTNLCNRRHYSKGARAYLALLVADRLLKGGRERGHSNIKKGENPNVSPERTECAPGDMINDFAAQIGVSPRTVDMAISLHQIFARDRQFKVTNEPRLLADEVGLPALISGWGGRLATRGKERPHATQLSLFVDGLDTLIKRFDYWREFRPPERQEFRQAMAARMARLDPDRRKELADWLTDLARSLRRAQTAIPHA